MRKCQHICSMLICVLISALPMGAVAFEAGDTLRILGIGNSFAKDALLQNLHEMLTEAEIPAQVGCLSISSASLQTHFQNACSNSKAYNYTLIDFDGSCTSSDNVALASVLDSQQWTHVSLQQVSEKSGFYDTYTPYVQPIKAYLKMHIPSSCEIMWHQTWAYQGDCTRGEFQYYNYDQWTMYWAIMVASNSVVHDYSLDRVIPCGTAIQNARTSDLGDNLTRDGCHLELTIGRYLAACTWFEALTGISSFWIEYKPEGMDEEDKQILNQAAVAAVAYPYEVTNLSNDDNKVQSIIMENSDEIYFDRSTGVVTSYSEIAIFDLSGCLVAKGYFDITLPYHGCFIIRTHHSIRKLVY